MEEFSLEIPEEWDGIRVDKCVSELMGEKLSRSRIQSMIKSDELLVNGKSVKPSYSVSEDDVVTFCINEPVEASIKPENIPLDILYEDNDLLVVNKPKGMVVHPAAGHTSHTLVNALMYHCKNQLSGINGVLRPGIVHRIDRDTSGSLVVCKNDIAHRILGQAFKEHSITRRYYGIVMGRLKHPQGTIDAPIGRHPVQRKRMSIIPVEKGGKRAVTHYKVLEQFERYALCEFTLETGRTHQIRVHMSSIHHPLLGDELYGGKEYQQSGQMLHAKILGFVHPSTGEYIEFDCELPEYFRKCLAKIENMK